ARQAGRRASPSSPPRRKGVPPRASSRPEIFAGRRPLQHRRVPALPLRYPFLRNAVMRRIRVHVMKRRLDVMGVAVLFLIGGGAAGATTLSTPPLSIGTDGSGLCEPVNLGQTPINVTLLPVALTPGPVFDPIACTGLAPNARCVVGDQHPP